MLIIQVLAVRVVICSLHLRTTFFRRCHGPGVERGTLDLDVAVGSNPVGVEIVEIFMFLNIEGILVEKPGSSH